MGSEGSLSVIKGIPYKTPGKKKGDISKKEKPR